MTYNPTQVSIVSVDAYDNVDIAGGPWDGSSTLKGPDVIGPGSYLLALAQLSCAIPDAGGDVILAKVTFQSLAEGNAAITLSRIPDFDTTVGCPSPPVTVYDTQMDTNTITIISISATSCDGYCGLQAPGGCFCDEYCHTAGDCSADENIVSIVPVRSARVTASLCSNRGTPAAKPPVSRPAIWLMLLRLIRGIRLPWTSGLLTCQSHL